MKVDKIRDTIAFDLREQLRKVMAGDDVVRYDVALQTAMKAAHMAAQMTANAMFRDKQMDLCLQVAGYLLAQSGDYSPRNQGHCAAVAVSMSELVAIAVAELDRQGANDAEEDATERLQQACP